MTKEWTLIIEGPDGKKVDFDVCASGIEEARVIAKDITKGYYGRFLAAKPKN